MWNGTEKRLKLSKLKFVWYLNVSGTVDSSVVRMVIGRAKWVLGRIFGAVEREAERYVTGIVCWQQIVLGGLDRGWEGKGVGGIVRHLLGNLDGESERKTILKSILLFKDLKRGTNKNIVWLFERHKPSPKPNTIILTVWRLTTHICVVQHR